MSKNWLNAAIARLLLLHFRCHSEWQAVYKHAGGWVRGTFIISQAGNMPEWMDHALRVLLHINGRKEFANPVDLPALGMLAILVASIVVCGLLVRIANVAIGRARTRRAQA
ncbi:hypothetical protein [Burkholderia gladioli]|uniref:Uncharacterized protein n=1 Tax=Burkholderia gladioli (strain BSR3) TaxID=999541 RepID=F2LA88_BURGS|nr:hypothetical protein [Burkholderia gladioli]AEA61334.1 hypothetical protein bgla_1g27170 [Burkholderia gladioli BSR3]